MKKRRIKYSISFLLVFISMLFFLSMPWQQRNFGSRTFDVLLFHIRVPLDGADMSNFLSIIPEVVVPALLLTALISLPFIKIGSYSLKILLNIKKRKIELDLFPSMFLKKYCFKISIALLFASFVFVVYNIGLITFISNQIQVSTIFEDEYVCPDSVNLVFPEQKRNLIIINLESIENTFVPKRLGGAFYDDLIPEMTKLNQENISFSHNDYIGGAVYAHGTSWTVAGLVASTAGIPIKVPIGGNNLGRTEYFLSNAVSLGTILEREGYNNMFMAGSDASFGGRRNFYEQHGNFEIFDYFTAVERGYIPEDYFVWWGFEDRKLYEFAKGELLELASRNEPFNFNMLTADTHFFDGYLDDYCPIVYQYENLINVLACASGKLYDFINWIREQDFYENTSIVIIADHLSMDQPFFDRQVDPNFERTIFNTFINPAATPVNTQNRVFTQMDFFPTMLASLGVEIEGDRLGLGTNLFSDRKTIPEEMGIETFNRELARNSRFYNDRFLFNR